MKQKLYHEPTMKVVKLSHKSQILAGSGETEGKSATMTVTYGEEDI